MTVNLSTRLPRDDNNGMAELAHVWSRDPSAMQVVIALVGCLSVTTHPNTDRSLYTARIEGCEGLALDSADGENAHGLWLRARTRRIGAVELPFEQDT